MTIDQKDHITHLIARILHGINRASAIAACIRNENYTQNIYVENVKDSLEQARRGVGELKQYLIQIDKETL